MQDRTIVREAAPRQVAPRASRPKSGWGAVVAIAIIAALALPILVGLGAVYRVWDAAESNDTTKTDAIVVLGAAQFNGTPSPVLRSRLQHSLDLYQAKVAPRIITVGGNQPGDAFTEAGAGRQWLIEQGVRPGDVIAVKAGTDTLESLQDVAAVAERNGWTSITLASDPAHMARSVAMANRLGFDAHANPTNSGDGSTVTDEYLYRETGAYLLFELVEQWSVDRVVEP